MKNKPASLPKFVTIAGRRLTVRVCPGVEAWGSYDHDDGAINISLDALQDPETAKATLRHEMMHAALKISGVGWSERYDEEAIVRCFENIFFPAWEQLNKR